MNLKADQKFHFTSKVMSVAEAIGWLVFPACSSLHSPVKEPCSAAIQWWQNQYCQLEPTQPVYRSISIYIHCWSSIGSQIPYFILSGNCTPGSWYTLMLWQPHPSVFQLTHTPRNDHAAHDSWARVRNGSQNYRRTHNFATRISFDISARQPSYLYSHHLHRCLLWAALAT